jgi:hypothetical protein
MLSKLGLQADFAESRLPSILGLMPFLNGAFARKMMTESVV